MLCRQMEKVVLFFLEQQGVLAGKLQRLREQREGSNTRGDESSLAIVMSSDFSDMMEQYRRPQDRCNATWGYITISICLPFLSPTASSSGREDNHQGAASLSPEQCPVIHIFFFTFSCRDVGRELLQLLQFVELNATGLRKILKKFDRRVGVRLGHTYIASRTLHPYSHLQQIFKQVVSGDVNCEL
ncbi:unnamed protein product [Closterium sp. NIES-54]